MYSDPSGHMQCYGGERCEGGGYQHNWDSDLESIGISYNGGNHKGKITAFLSANLAAYKSYQSLQSFILISSPQMAFKIFVGAVIINVFDDDVPGSGNCETVDATISCHQPPDMPNTLHEFAHVLDNHLGGMSSTLGPYYDSEGNPIDMDSNGFWTRTSNGFLCADSVRCMEHPPSMGYWDSENCGGTSAQSSYCARIEQWADLFLNWVLDGTGDPNHGFTNNFQGDARRLNILNLFKRMFNNGYLP